MDTVFAEKMWSKQRLLFFFFFFFLGDVYSVVSKVYGY